MNTLERLENKYVECKFWKKEKRIFPFTTLLLGRIKKKFAKTIRIIHNYRYKNHVNGILQCI